MEAVRPIKWFAAQVRAVYARLLGKSIAGARVDQRYSAYTKLDHPLMLQLKQSMPGTYRHSIVVGNMAAAAGQKIGVDPDLIRCIGYYHDIGKTVRPDLYTEGQSGDRNGLRPVTTREELSAIMFHPRASQYILSEHDFPAKVLSAVVEHHGDIMTRLKISDKLRAQLEPGQLHYPGPRPSSRESAIVMLADSVEAVLNRRRSSQDWPADLTCEFLKTIICRVGKELRRAGQFKDASFSRCEQRSVVNSLMWWMFRYYHEPNPEKTPNRSSPA